MTSPISAAEYYQNHAAEEQEYVRVYAARSIRAGDATINSVGGLNIMGRAPEAGYELSAYRDFRDSEKEYLSAQEFKDKTAPAGQLPPAAAREDMTAQDLNALTPVSKGQSITIDAGLPIATTAPYDGFTVDVGKDLPVYMSNYELTALFNYAGAKKSTHEDAVVRLKDEAPVKGIVLKEDVTFDFKQGPYEAKAGSFLYANPDDIDGFTVTGPGYAHLALRQNVTPQQLAARSKMATDAPIKARGPAKFKKG